MKNLYYELYPTELVGKDELSVFLFCGRYNIPNECLCGCGLKRLFTNEEQMYNFNKYEMFRFFQNASHIKRFRKLVKNKM